MLTNEGSNRTFLTVYEGKIAQRVSKDTPGAKHRITKSGKEVYELFFDTLTGYLEDIRLDDPPEANKQIGKQWCFVLEDGNETYELKLPHKSNSAFGLLSRLMNLDFSKPVKVKTYWITGDDDVNRGFAVFLQIVGEEVKKVPPFFTRDDPKGLPAPKKIVIDGEERWDFTDRLKFLKRVVDEKILPRLKEARPLSEADKESYAPVEEPVAPPPTEEDFAEYEDSNDLPF